MTSRRAGSPDGYRRTGNLFVPKAVAESAGEAGQAGASDAGARGDGPSRWRDVTGPGGGPRERYRDLLEGLSSRVVGHDSTLRRLALAGLQHILGAGDQRLVLVGPTGAGKTTLCHALADTLDVPVLAVNVAELAETNWAGLNLSELIMGLHERTGGDHELMARSLVLLDEIDKVGLGSYAGAGWEYRRGKQESLLALLEGQEVPYGESRNERNLVWSASRALVVSAGVFEGLAAPRPGPSHLIEWGLLPELVGRLGTVLSVDPLDPEDVREILRRQLEPLAVVYEALGFELVVTSEAMARVAGLVTGPGEGLDMRSAARLLRDAAERGLVGLLEAEGTGARRFELEPSDLELPGADRRAASIGFG